jgi:hypothetical protein
MKKKHNLFASSHLRAFVLSCLLLSAFTLHAQTPIYQLPNNGFETWYRETSNAGSIVPTNFNSFYSASTTGLTGLGVAQRCDSSRDVRVGAPGTYSLYMYSNSTLGVRANGNVTTGRMSMGSTTASNSANYNWTEYVTSAPKFYQEITGTPDSLRFWVKYLPGRTGTVNTEDKGRIRVYIHGSGPCRDAPAYPTGMTEVSQYYGKAMKEFYKEDGNWHCYQVPFEYTGTNTTKNANGNYYALVSMTTNAIPGGGANDIDKVWFDDIEFVYSAWLTDLKVNGVTIDGFNKNLLTYGGPVLECPVGECAFPYQPSDFSYTKEADDATVVVTNILGPNDDADGGYTSVLVTAEDGVTIKEYKIWYFSNRSDDNNIIAMNYTINGVAEIPITPFIPSQINYYVHNVDDPEETLTPQIVESSIVLSDATAEIQRIEQPTGVNSKGMVVVRAENLALKTYNVFFTKAQSTNNTLNWIKVGGVDVTEFDADTLTYDHLITTCTTTFPAVTYEKTSAYANVLYTPATLVTKKATITVTAENGAQRTYTVNFEFSNDNAALTGYRINTTNQNNVFNATTFTHTYTANLTAPFTLSLNGTAQQGCAGSTVVFSTPLVWYPDTNKIHVTAMNGINQQTYGVIVKNTNCYLTTGAGNGVKYKYNGVTYNTINITTANNNNTNTVNYNITLPIGPNEPAELISANPIAPVVDTIIYTQPASRADMGSVKVVANDGTTNKTYTVTFSATLSSDATLSYIKYDGLPVPGFNPVTEVYTLIFPSTTTEVPELDFAPTFQWLPEENIDYIPAPTLADTALIVVTAENGTTIKTYKIAFEVVAQEKDAYLIDIRYDNVSIPGFNPTITYYMVDVPYSNPTPPATTPYASSPTALVFGDVQNDTPPYTKNYLVYSEDMTITKIYTLDFNRIKNTNPYLTDIQINGVSLQSFNPEEFEYEIELPYTVFDAPVVTATPVHPYADVEILQINTVAGTVTINVTAEDDTFTATYTIDFTRELSPVTRINAIEYEYDDATYWYEVESNETEFLIPLPVETLGEPVITNIVLADDRSDYEIEEQPDASNDYTGTITVMAENLTEEIYSVTFQRTLSGSTLLTGIFINGVLIEGFDPDVLNYEHMLPFNETQIQQVTATAAWVGTEVFVTQASTPFGQATVMVTSEDGQNNKTYTITFLRKGNCQLASLEYTLDGETMIPVPNFSPTTYVYDITLNIGTTETPVVSYVAEDNRCAITDEQPNSPNGTFWVKLVTWNGDDSLTYTVNFTVMLSTEALLSDLQVEGVTIPNFDPNIFHYVFPMYEYGTQPLPAPEVAATAKHIDAQLTISQAGGYPGTATVFVVAGNPNYTNTYTIDFSVEAGDNNYLEDLLIGGVHLWNFNKEQCCYTVDLPHGTTEFPDVEAIPKDERATVAYDLQDNLMIITVTAINGDEREYQVLFVIRGNDNAYVTMIYVDGELLPDFDPFVKEYVYQLPAGYTGMPWIAVETEDPNATWALEVLPPNKILVIITAEDGVTKMIYTITFERSTSIISFDNEINIQVYPNPSDTYINFVINQIGNLEIFSMEGKKIGIYYLNEGVNTVNVETLPQGLYFYKIFSNKVLLGTGKFVKN